MWPDRGHTIIDRYVGTYHCVKSIGAEPLVMLRGGGTVVDFEGAPFNMGELISTTTKQYLMPESGKWETLDDLDGAAIAGPPDVIVERCGPIRPPE